MNFPSLLKAFSYGGVALPLGRSSAAVGAMDTVLLSMGGILFFLSISSSILMDKEELLSIELVEKI